MQLFYTNNIANGIAFLDTTDSKHCVKVLRLSQGDKVELVDGKGGLYQGEIALSNPKKCEVRILSHIEDYNKRANYLHIAIAPTKNISRLEWFLEKSCEIGIDEVTPIICERSERKVIKIERLEKVLISAMKQSLRAYLPKLNNPVNCNDFLDSNSTEQKFIAHCDFDNKKMLKEEYMRGKDVVLLIGPEGDFSEKEIELANKNGFKSVLLGGSRLRTETAGIVACNTINLINE